MSKSACWLVDSNCQYRPKTIGDPCIRDLFPDVSYNQFPSGRFHSIRFISLCWHRVYVYGTAVSTSVPKRKKCARDLKGTFQEENVVWDPEVIYRWLYYWHSMKGPDYQLPFALDNRYTDWVEVPTLGLAPDWDVDNPLDLSSLVSELLRNIYTTFLSKCLPFYGHFSIFSLYNTSKCLFSSYRSHFFT